MASEHDRHVSRLEQLAHEVGAARARARYFTADEVSSWMTDEDLAEIGDPEPEYQLRVWAIDDRLPMVVITLDAELVEHPDSDDVIRRFIRDTADGVTRG